MWQVLCFTSEMKRKNKRKFLAELEIRVRNLILAVIEEANGDGLSIAYPRLVLQYEDRHASFIITLSCGFQ